MMQIRDRIKELRRVKAATLRPHPRNWRPHPPAPRDALRGMLAEIGYADALLARELPDGSLELIDGHLRAETTPESDVPVLVLDLEPSEADKLRSRRTTPRSRRRSTRYSAAERSAATSRPGSRRTSRTLARNPKCPSYTRSSSNAATRRSSAGCTSGSRARDSRAGC